MVDIIPRCLRRLFRMQPTRSELEEADDENVQYNVARHDDALHGLFESIERAKEVNSQFRITLKNAKNIIMNGNHDVY